MSNIVEEVDKCGDCPCYRYGKAYKIDDKIEFKPGLCDWEDVSDELSCDNMPEWCPLHKGDLVIRLKR